MRACVSVLFMIYSYSPEETRRVTIVGINGLDQPGPIVPGPLYTPLHQTPASRRGLHLRLHRMDDALRLTPCV